MAETGRLLRFYRRSFRPKVGLSDAKLGFARDLDCATNRNQNYMTYKFKNNCMLNIILKKDYNKSVIYLNSISG